jgi:pimeloyl-ACP methyl ester carboxylesterase
MAAKQFPIRFRFRCLQIQLLNTSDSKKLTEVSIFGYSMGGYVALYLAAYYPERINKIFTLATKFDWTEATSEKEAAMLDPEKISEKVPAFATALEKVHAPQDWKKVLEKTAAMLLNLGRAPALTEKECTQIKIPVTIGIGEQDKMVSIDETKQTVSRIKNAKLLQLPDTPHAFEKVNHEMLANFIKEFFG